MFVTQVSLNKFRDSLVKINGNTSDFRKSRDWLRHRLSLAPFSSLARKSRLRRQNTREVKQLQRRRQPDRD